VFQSGERNRQTLAELNWGLSALSGQNVTKGLAMRHSARTLAVLAVLCALCGCAGNAAVVPVRQPPLSEPLVQRWPLRVGIHIAPQFRDKVHTSSFSVDLRSVNNWTLGQILQTSGTEWTFPIGGESAKLILFCVRSLFDHVVEIDRWPGSEAGNLDGVLVARDMHVVTSAASPESFYFAVVYRFELQSPRGELLAAWEVRGSGNGVLGRGLNSDGAGETWAVSVERGLRDAAARFLNGFSQHAGVDRWLLQRSGDTGAKSPDAAGGISIAPGLAATRSEQEAMRGAAVPVSAANALTITSNPPLTDVTSVQCLEQAFRNIHPHLSLVPGEKVRNALFPLLDTNLEPRDEEAYLELLRRPAVTARLMDINIRYVAMPRLATQTERMDGPFTCGGSGMGAGCFGGMSGKVESTLAVQVLDLATGNVLGEPIATTGKGTSWVVGFIFPVWNTADTKEATCSQAASEIVKRLPR
jgi:hypothetical protein